jgi:hypothetical protein
MLKAHDKLSTDHKQLEMPGGLSTSNQTLDTHYYATHKYLLTIIAIIPQDYMCMQIDKALYIVGHFVGTHRWSQATHDAANRTWHLLSTILSSGMSVDSKDLLGRLALNRLSSSGLTSISQDEKTPPCLRERDGDVHRLLNSIHDILLNRVRYYDQRLANDLTKEGRIIR